MKKQIIIAVIILAVIVLGVIGYKAAIQVERDTDTEKNDDAPTVSFKEYSFDKVGIKLSAPADMSVVSNDFEDNVFTLTIERGKYPEPSYYQLYGILQATSNPTFDAESVKKDLADGATDTTIGGAAAVQGQHKGERNNLVTIIFTNKGIFRLTTTPPSAESAAITNSILDTLTFTFADNPTTPSSDIQAAIQEILAKKYNRPLSEVHITVKKEAPGFASGSVKFGQGGVGEGGMWLAIKKDGFWQVVFDGNGSVNCNKMRQEYGFPDIILKPDFCDAKAFEAEAAVTNFEECVAAGNPVMESYPRQCRHEGTTYVENLGTMTQEEALRIAREAKECSMTGILSDRVSYNPNSKTWWIDLDRMPELEKDGCKPACVVNEQTKIAEVNWRCTGLKKE